MSSSDLDFRNFKEERYIDKTRRGMSRDPVIFARTVDVLYMRECWQAVSVARLEGGYNTTYLLSSFDFGMEAFKFPSFTRYILRNKMNPRNIILDYRHTADQLSLLELGFGSSEPRLVSVSISIRGGEYQDPGVFSGRLLYEGVAWWWEAVRWLVYGECVRLGCVFLYYIP